jgi:hypothetical protein
MLEALLVLSCRSWCVERPQRRHGRRAELKGVGQVHRRG